MSSTSAFLAAFFLVAIHVVYTAPCGADVCDGVAAGRSSSIQDAPSNTNLCSCTCGGGGERPLHVAARAACKSCIDMLVNGEGCDANPKDDGGNIPLHVAAGQCGNSIVIDLLDRGANVNAADNQGDQPVCDAARGSSNECVDVVNTLIGNGASPCTRCRDDALLYTAATLTSVRDTIGDLGGSPESCF